MPKPLEQFPLRLHLCLPLQGRDNVLALHVWPCGAGPSHWRAPPRGF